MKPTRKHFEQVRDSLRAGTLDFDMDSISGCIGFHVYRAANPSAPASEAERFVIDNRREELFWPANRRCDSISAEEAATGIDNWLATGDPKWQCGT
jgi:hypothetical protein